MIRINDVGYRYIHRIPILKPPGWCELPTAAILLEDSGSGAYLEAYLGLARSVLYFLPFQVKIGLPSCLAYLNTSLNVCFLGCASVWYGWASFWYNSANCSGVNNSKAPAPVRAAITSGSFLIPPDFLNKSYNWPALSSLSELRMLKVSSTDIFPPNALGTFASSTITAAGVSCATTWAVGITKF